MTLIEAEVPVLIVGGGAAGLAMSLLLSRHGTPSLLIDERQVPSPLPRARGVHSRAMEILRVCGAEPELRAHELPITPGAQWQSDLPGAPAGQDVPGGPDGPAVSPCEGLALSQDVFESVLHEHAASYRVAQLRRGTRLESFTVHDGYVEAQLAGAGTGAGQAVRARYLVAADGARSGIRHQLGIGLTGPGALGRQFMVSFRADLSRWAGPRPRGIYFLTAAAAALIWTHPDHRWIVSIPAGGEGPDPGPAALVRAALGLPDLPLQVLASGGWTARGVSADRYAGGDGRVFLIGDAAHQFPPAGATGVSTAIADAHNLAWKLAAVLAGDAGPALLGTYDPERGPVGRRNATETAAAWSRVWNPAAPVFAGRSLRQIDLGYQYRSPAITSDGSPGADPAGADYAPTGAPGTRAPHVWLQGGVSSTIDLFDQDFTLLTAEPGSGWRIAADQVKPALGLTLRQHVMPPAGWPAPYGVSPEGAVLVRPDGHIAWRSPDAATDSRAAVTALVSAVRAAAQLA
jgi:2-polyprenyl-6-methoxyphenol hydroxylase-like FAD-dependent oxidoreductase